MYSQLVHLGTFCVFFSFFHSYYSLCLLSSNFFDIGTFLSSFYLIPVILYFSSYLLFYTRSNTHRRILSKIFAGRALINGLVDTIATEVGKLKGTHSGHFTEIVGSINIGTEIAVAMATHTSLS